MMEKKMTRIINWINIFMNMNIKRVMIGKMKAVHWLIWVVEKTKKRGNLFQSILHSHCNVNLNIVCMQIFLFGNA